MVSTDPTGPYVDAKTKQFALAYGLFKQFVLHEWYATLALMYTDVDGTVGNRAVVYLDQPSTTDSYGRRYLGGHVLLVEVRRFAAEARCERGHLDDDKFKQLIEEVLREELDKYGFVLVWRTRHNWDGTDRVLDIYGPGEQVPPPS